MKPLCQLFTVVLFLILLKGVVAEEDLKSRSATFIELLSKEEFKDASKEFDATMLVAMPVKKLEATWQTLQSQVGKFQKQGVLSQTSHGAHEICDTTCDFEKSKLIVRVVFDKNKKIAGLFFLPPNKSSVGQKYQRPDYVDQEKFHEMEVVIGKDPWKLPATLTIPKGEGPFPAIILVHGSGPNDRDETIGLNRPFKDLAGGLATRGIAVLRYDKRTLVYRDKISSLAEFTVKEETVDDAFAAANFLRRKSDAINPNGIFILGHSLGGYLVPRMALQKRGEDIAGFVVLAGAARPLDQLILEQTDYLLNLDGELSDADRSQISSLKTLVDQIRSSSLESQKDGPLLLGVPAGYWLDLREYHPERLAASSLKQPAFFLQGERDYQVTMEDFSIWKTALSSRSNIQLKSYPDLNHLFIPGEGPGTPKEYEKAGHVSPAVIEDIANWIIGQF